MPEGGRPFEEIKGRNIKGIEEADFQGMQKSQGKSRNLERSSKISAVETGEALVASDLPVPLYRCSILPRATLPNSLGAIRRVRWWRSTRDRQARGPAACLRTEKAKFMPETQRAEKKTVCPSRKPGRKAKG